MKNSIGKNKTFQKRHALFRAIAWVLTRTLYRVHYKKMEQLPEKGAAILVCNHVSYVDALIIYAASPRPIRFVMHAAYYRTPILRWLFRAAGVIPIDSGRKNPALLNQAMKEISATLRRGDLICLFPEGKLTQSGHVESFRPGIEHILQHNPVPVIPLALRGLWGSIFSHKGGPALTHLPRRFWSRIELAVGYKLHPKQVTAGYLRSKVLHLRGARA